MTRTIQQLFDLTGKTALVTGGSRGLGLQLAHALGEAGARIMLSSRKAEDLEQAAAELQAAGIDARWIAADCAKESEIVRLADETLQRMGDVDILVNNAGASWGAPLDEFPESGWDKVMDTNVKGVFFLTQKLLPPLRKAAAGDSPARVINIGSIDGLKSAIFDTFSYGASKAAVHHLTRFMAAHLTKERILFNAIAPGPFPTWMLSTGVGFGGATENVDWDRVGQRNPSGRVGTPQDIAGLAIFLCSRAGEFVVGQTIACDGGSVAAS